MKAFSLPALLTVIAATSGCAVMPESISERFDDPNVFVVSDPYQPGVALGYTVEQSTRDTKSPALQTAYFPATGGAIVEAVAGQMDNAAHRPRPHVIHAGKLRENINSVLRDYGWMEADFTDIPKCAHWEVTADYTLVATGIADAMQRLLNGYPLVVDLHQPTRQARVTFAGANPIRCEA